MVGELPKSSEVHLSLILRISGQNPHCDAINRLKKFVTLEFSYRVCYPPK